MQIIKPKFHYAWVTLICACAMDTIGFGMALSSMGVFFPYVREYFGIGVGQTAFYLTIQGLVMTATMPFVGKAVQKYNYNVILTVAAVILSGGLFLMSTFTSLWQWYLMAIPSGIAVAFIAPIPNAIIVSNWFEKRRGFATGIATAASGAIAALLVPSCNWFIESFGWRVGYRYYAILAAVFLLPVALFFLHKTPEEMGMLPYGAEERKEENTARLEHKTNVHVAEYGMTLRDAMRRPSFYLVIIVAVTLTWAGGMNPQLPTHTTVLGLGAATGALMSSACEGMQLIFNVPLGSLIDRIGVGRATVIYSVVAALGSLLLCIARTPVFLYLGAMLYGVGLCQTIVVSTQLPRVIFGRKDYGRINSVVMMAFGLSGSLGFTVNGWLLDSTGSYSLSFVITAVCDVIAVACCLLALKLEKKQVEINKEMEGLIVEED